MLNERLHFNFGSETEQYEASLESRIRSKGAFHYLPATTAEIFAAAEKAKREKDVEKTKEQLMKKDNDVKKGSEISPIEQK
jgi:hypothetical protein